MQCGEFLRVLQPEGFGLENLQVVHMSTLREEKQPTHQGLLLQPTREHPRHANRFTQGSHLVPQTQPVWLLQLHSLRIRR